MKTSRLQFTRATSLTMIAALSAAVTASAAHAGEFKGHPHLKAAHNKLDHALQDLKEANNGKVEFGGHREKAEDLIHQAQKEIEEAADFANQHDKK